MNKSNKKSPIKDFIKNIVIAFVIIMFSIGFYFAIFKLSVRFFKATYNLYHLDCDLEKTFIVGYSVINGMVVEKEIPLSLENRVSAIEECLSK